MDSSDEIIILTEQLRNKSADNEQLSVLVGSQEKQIADLNLYVEELFRNQWNTLNTLCNEFYEKDSESMKVSIVKSIEKEIAKIVNEGNIEHIEETVNKSMNDIAKSLREQCGFLKESDFVFIILNYAGFTARTVCMFTGIKFKHFYNKRARLIERIAKSDAKDKELFVSKLK